MSRRKAREAAISQYDLKLEASNPHPYIKYYTPEEDIILLYIGYHSIPKSPNLGAWVAIFPALAT